MRDAGHRAVAATLVHLQEFCVWQGVETQVHGFVRQYLHCADSRAGDIVPRPLGETVHGTMPGEVVHFDYPHMGEGGPQASQGLSEDGGFRHILVLLNDWSDFVPLEPVVVGTVELTSSSLLN